MFLNLIQYIRAQDYNNSLKYKIYIYYFGICNVQLIIHSLKHVDHLTEKVDYEDYLNSYREKVRHHMVSYQYTGIVDKTFISLSASVCFCL